MKKKKNKKTQKTYVEDKQMSKKVTWDRRKDLKILHRKSKSRNITIRIALKSGAPESIQATYRIDNIQRQIILGETTTGLWFLQNNILK